MRFVRVGIVAAIAVVGAVAACGEELIIEPLPAAAVDEFSATLSGANETPAVTTTATGTARFAVMNDSILAFSLDVVTIDSLTLAHIHEGAAGVAGPIIVNLFVDTLLQNRAAYTGPVRQAQFRPSGLTSLPAGFGATARARFDSLLSLMRAGGVYVNVHTRQNPAGEIRGQIQPAP